MITDFKVIGTRVDIDFTKYLLSSISQKNIYCIVGKDGNGRFTIKPGNFFVSEENQLLNDDWTIVKKDKKIIKEITDSIDIDIILSDFITDNQLDGLDIATSDI